MDTSPIYRYHCHTACRCRTPPLLNLLCATLSVLFSVATLHSVCSISSSFCWLDLHPCHVDAVNPEFFWVVSSLTAVILASVVARRPSHFPIIVPSLHLIRHLHSAVFPRLHACCVSLTDGLVVLQNVCVTRVSSSKHRMRCSAWIPSLHFRPRVRGSAVAWAAHRENFVNR